jgi:hypothetical protein
VCQRRGRERRGACPVIGGPETYISGRMASGHVHPPTPYCFRKSAETKERKGVATIPAHGKSEKSAEGHEKKRDEWRAMSVGH